MTGADIPRDPAGRVIRPRPSQLLADVMEKLGPDHLTTRTLMAALIERDRGAGAEPRAVSPRFGIHIPVLGDPPNVPYDMQETVLDIEGLDTGARNITSLLVNGWNSGVVLLQRIGSTVFLSAVDIIAPATWNAQVIGTPPTGFQGSGFWGSGYNMTGAAGLANNPPFTDSTGLLRINGPALPASTRLRLSLVYPTTQAWPTTLPGTPVLLRDLLDTVDPLPAGEG